MTPLLTLIKRDLRLFAARGGEGVSVVFFFLIVATLFALALGGQPEILAQAGPAVIWVSALLGSLLALEQLYHRDVEDGTTDLLLLSSLSPFSLAVAKAVSHWLVAGLPLLLAAAVAGRMLFLEAAALPVFLCSLLLGSLYMSLLGGFCALLTLGAKRPGLLLALIALPLYIPMLLLGVMAGEAALAGSPYKPYLLLQAALLFASLPLSLLASSALLKMHLRSN